MLNILEKNVNNEVFTCEEEGGTCISLTRKSPQILDSSNQYRQLQNKSYVTSLVFSPIPCLKMNVNLYIESLQY